MRLSVNKVALILLTMTVLGCSSLQDRLFPTIIDKDAKVEWEKNVKITVNNKVYYGLAVPKRAPEYNINVYPSYKEIDLVQWKTCHRGGDAPEAVVHSRWSWNKQQGYFPLNFKLGKIENERACPLRIEALTMKKKTMGFAYVIFPDSRPWVTLSATLECNGLSYHYDDGVSACQAPVGTIQRIVVNKTAIADDRPNEKCPPLDKTGPGVYEYFMPKGECLYLFKTPKKDESGNYLTHLHYTFGYEKTPPAER